ncbi:GNAT family N-acetyltransferase, partial [Salmonella enterica]|uniref:GNAT family N-acetyltransferase n=1 Tax=Salmonella enterica TaxID=28901 RepID=UPI003EDBAA80
METAIWRDGHDIVGIAQMRLVTPGVVELSGLTVAPTHRKRGIGRRLMGALFDFAQRHSDQVYIETAADNNPANHLYGNILRCKQV